LAGNGNTYKDYIIVSELKLHCANVGIKQIGTTKPEKCISYVFVHPFMPDTSKGI